MSRELTIENTGLPVGWEMKKLLEISTVLTGKHNANHSKNDGKYRFYTCAYDHLFCDTKRFKGECLVLPGNGVNVGEVFYFDGEFDAYQRTYVIFNIKINVRYLHYHMLLYWRELGTKLQYGSATNFIKIGNFQDYKVSLAPLPQQKQIVATLDKAFAAIDTAKANAEQNLKNAKELFESYLQNVFENKGDDWEEYELKEIVDEKCSLSYGIVQPGNPFPNGLPVIRPTNMKNKFVSPLGLKLIDPAKAKSYNRTTLVGDELLLCVRGETGVISITTVELKGANVTRGIVPVCFDSEKLSLPFGYYLFVSPLVQKQIKDKTYGAALMQINIRDVRELQMLIPSKKEQEIIVQKLDTLSQEVRKLKAIYIQKIADLEEMKKSVLQKAFSGQLNTVT
jgi:restriction endonuclease S subunit